MPKLSLTVSIAITATALSLSAFVQPAPVVAQDRGPAIVVPTDVTRTQIDVVDPSSPSPPSASSALRVRFEKPPDKVKCKKYLIQADADTKCSEVSDGAIRLENGKVLVAPVDGRLLVHTKLADISVPKDGIALIRCELDQLAIFNLAGREFVVHFAEKEGAPHHKSAYDEGIGMDEGFGIVSNGPKDSIASGILQYVGTEASSSVVIAVAMRNCKLAVIDPMRILQQDSILKSLTADKWLPVLQKLEDTTERVGVWQKEQGQGRR